MTKLAVSILISLGLIAGLTACGLGPNGEPSPAQAEAAAFREKCDKNPKLKECVEWRCTQTGVCDIVPDEPAK